MNEPTALNDQHGRVARDLRLSVTDRCNLRCSYCMPAEGLEWLASDQVLTDDEIVRLVRIGVCDLGITAVRITGGEPLVRPGLPGLISRFAALDPRPEISLTTNGIGLERVADALANAGLSRINVSLDTLRPDRFLALARRARLDDVLAGLTAAAASGLTPVKVNTVLMRGVNDDEAVELLVFCLEHGYELRFIEQMPLEPMHEWSRAEMVTGPEILDRLGAAFQLTPDPSARGSAPAQTWVVNGGPFRVGVIAAVTAPFCGDCDRTRITADGQVRNCLFAREESDLRGLLRGGASDNELADAWVKAMWAKAAGHGVNDPIFRRPDRPMSAIGG